tara:strand:- start:43 stop:414 length:372 start_codon:yes stop_codon:yes gene_type:complete
MADEKAGPIARGFADATPKLENLKKTQEMIKDMLEGLTPGAAVSPTLKDRILDKIKDVADLGASTTKLLNKFGIETPKQKLEKKKKKREKDPQNVEIISAKAGRLIKCGAQIKGTSPLIRKRK